MTKSGRPDRRFKRRAEPVESAAGSSGSAGSGGSTSLVPVVRGSEELAAARHGEELERIRQVPRRRPTSEEVREEAVTYRSHCRNIVLDEEVMSNIAIRARCDAEFALKLASHGFGSVPQQVQVSGEVNVNQREVVYVVEVPGGEVVSPDVAGLSAPCIDVDG